MHMHSYTVGGQQKFVNAAFSFVSLLELTRPQSLRILPGLPTTMLVATAVKEKFAVDARDHVVQIASVMVSGVNTLRQERG